MRVTTVALLIAGILGMLPIRVSLAQGRDAWLRQELADMNRCGPLALQVCAIAVGRTTHGAEIETHLPRTGREWTLAELEGCARELGLKTLAVKWQHLPRTIATPAVIPIVRNGQNHYVALLGRDGDRVLIVDAPYAPGWISLAELRGRLNWNGTSLHISAGHAPLWILSWSVHGRTILTVLALLLGAVWCIPRLSRFWRRTSTIPCQTEPS